MVKCTFIGTSCTICVNFFKKNNKMTVRAYWSCDVHTYQNSLRSTCAVLMVQQW